MATIYETAERFVQSTVRRERAAAAVILDRYGQTYKRVTDEAKRLAKDLARLPETEPDRQDIEAKMRRIEAIQAQVKAEMDQFAQVAETTIVTSQREAVEEGAKSAGSLLEQAAEKTGFAIQFDRLPTEAYERFIGMTATGSPLRKLFEQFGADAADRIIDEIATGIAAGWNPTRIAKRLKKVMGGDLTRALTVARTETLRAYRDAARSVYNSSPTVKRMRWIASFSTRTCALCFAMHGKTFPVSGEIVSTHPNCRCTFIPVIEELDDQEPLPPAEPYLNSLPEEDLIGIMGKQKAEAYLAGRFKLDDLIGRRVDKDWGVIYYERSYAEVVKKRNS